MNKPPSDQFCPLWRKAMSKVCGTCPWWQHVRGANPNTGAEVDHYACAIAWMPMLLIEAAQQSRQTGAAVESFRNETVKASKNRVDAINRLADQMNGGRLVGSR